MRPHTRLFRSTRALTLAVVAPLVVVGAAWGYAGSTAQAAPAVRAAAAPTPIDFVALGDSYSAGPLIPDQRPDPSGCLRSSNNYPAYLAGYFQVTTYRDVTCSGARTRDFSHRQTLIGGGETQRQLSALSADTDIVTVGIGGNDYSLFGSMVDACPAVRQADPTGNPCEVHFTTYKGVNTRYRAAERIQRHIGWALSRIHEHAPNAKVYLIGYPRLLPAEGHCKAPAVAWGDYAFMNKVERLLNRSLANAASHHHATFVSLSGASKGHDVCAGDDAWINGAQIKLGEAANFHPFRTGERGMARAIFRAITGDAAPTNWYAKPPTGSVVSNPPVS